MYNILADNLRSGEWKHPNFAIDMKHVMSVLFQMVPWPWWSLKATVFPLCWPYILTLKLTTHILKCIDTLIS